jgi:transcriptional regulator with XRE-family HTH domain
MTLALSFGADRDWARATRWDVFFMVRLSDGHGLDAQQPDILFWEHQMNDDRKRCRSRMPAGFVGFRGDLGGVIRDARKAARMKQQTLADLVGITRTRLSAIEKERAWPLPDTISGLRRELELEDEQVYLPDEGTSAAPSVVKQPGVVRREQLGRALRKQRKAKGLTLRQLSESCGLSVSQLSRIERGLASYSCAFEIDPYYADLDKDDRLLKFKLKGLLDLFDGGTD